MDSSRLERRLSKEVLELQKELKSLKDCKTVDDFVWDNLELQRGETPEDIKERCLKLCKDYIAGLWERQTVDTINVKRLSGGLTNQLYYCSIAEPIDVKTLDRYVPQEVAIRLYGPKYFNKPDEGNERLTDVVIALMTSENGLGPKVYGIFEDGQIQHFYKHRQFRYDEQINPVSAEKLFQALARVHSMDVPIKKNTNWVFKFFDENYEKASAKGNLSSLFEEFKCKTLLERPLKTEIDWLKKTIIDINVPNVFSHIDFRGSNIMVTEPEDKLVLCDFEYSSYGYRGFDFGTILVEWNRTNNELFRWDPQLNDKFPEDSQLKTLCEYYIKEMVKINGKEWSKNAINSLDQLMKEAKLFTLVACMFIISFCIKNDEQDQNDFPMDKNVMMGMADQCYQTYFHLKNRFIEQKMF